MFKNIFGLNFLKKRKEFPPLLSSNYDMEEYLKFMREEIFLYTKKYAKDNVFIHDREILFEATQRKGAVLAPLHYGSYFLSGCALVQQLKLSCNAIVTHNNLLILPEKEANFWRFAHRQVEKLQRQSIFYAGKTSRNEIINTLQKKNSLIWSMLDVREVGRERPEFAFDFQGTKIYLQTGSARLASLANVPLIPICIQYNLDEKRHHLYIGEPILSKNSPIEMTQAALIQLESIVSTQPNQFFHNMDYFSSPQVQVSL